MSSATSSSSGPQDNYALDILTQAAMHTRQATSNGSTFGSDPSVSSTTLITNQHDTHSTEAENHRSIDGYNLSMLSSRDLDALAFNSPPRMGRQQHPYLTQAFEGLGSQLAMANSNGLGILNAESYDDGRGATAERQKTKSKHVLPFGMTDHPHIRLDRKLSLDDDQHDSSPRRKKPRIEKPSPEDEEEVKGKNRGRPRVNPKDETAADRRRTQIRMAQRAYRHRKESTISSLEKKVQDLTGANEEMSNIFIHLYDFAVSKGLLQREPEFGQQLQTTTERFLALAKASEDEAHEENQEDGIQNDEAEHSRRPNGQKISPKRRQEEAQPVSQIPVSQSTPTYGGYTLAKDESPEMDMAYKQEDRYRDSQYDGHQYRARHSDVEIITRPTVENASFPFEFMDIQQYRVEVPQIDEFSENFLQYQPPLPKSFAYNEFSFSRRIHRRALERGLSLITSNDPLAQERAQRVFHFSLMYCSKEAITARLRRLVGGSAKDSLQVWRAPFVHVGGAGTYYPMHESDGSWELMPKFRTGYSMGPFSPEVAEAQAVLDSNLKCALPGFEGDFFDASDVEGYLRGRGIDIAPAADFVTVELDLLALSEAPSPKSSSSDGIMSIISPITPRSPVESFLQDAEKKSNTFELDMVKPESSLRILNPVTQTLPFPLGFANWDDDSSIMAGNDSVDAIFNTKPDQSGSDMAEISLDARQHDNNRTVTLDVNFLLEEIIKRGVCLGRAPGFKPADVDAALIAAVKAGS